MKLSKTSTIITIDQVCILTSLLQYYWSYLCIIFNRNIGFFLANLAISTSLILFMSTNWLLKTDWFIVCLLNMYLSVNTKKIIDDKKPCYYTATYLYIYELSLSEKDKKNMHYYHIVSHYGQKSNILSKNYDAFLYYHTHET